ncbi:hypothetical protein Q4519_03430 [Motilimonas sp. 1_MG-2023]|uniref:hypothetical protein n=1 Tax=Motilimonas sp. 1_MG-2023 TaxID=3062672 RepID=UPI0026E239F6|nr:hypothetical protein [Motilimonas sp. 1_MG-2023]MDO6524729.1 hypothetical protein [Motilimonas sp. 1_MG-2023]
MSNVVSLHEYFYNLMITNGINNFTVIELRDEILAKAGNVFCSNTARIYVYRRILYLESKQLLRKTQSGPGKQVRYLTTPLFKKTRFSSKSTLKNLNTSTPDNQDISFHEALLKEKRTYEKSLKVTEQEVATFASLIKRYPYQQDHVQPFLNQAREDVHRLQSQMNAISKILEVTSS